MNHHLERAESDSKITNSNEAKSSPLCGVLKTIILNPYISLSFAGNVSFAEEAVKYIIENNIFNNFNDLIKYLIHINKKSELSTDFAIASVINSNPKLYKISNGQFLQHIQQFWLGDKDGFENYQRNFNNIPKSSLKDKIRSSFTAVIDNSTVKTVGDFHISTELNYDICNSHPGTPVFLYAEKIAISVSEPQTIEFEEEGQCKPIPLGTTAGGSHGISYLVSVSPKLYGIAIHYIHGNFGILFCPQINYLEGIIISNVNSREFIDAIKKEYNLPLKGFIRASSSAVQYVDTRN